MDSTTGPPRRRWRHGRACIVLGVALLVTAALAAVSSSGAGPRAGLATGSRAGQTSAAVTALLKGIPQSGSTLGSSAAPVTVQYFGDLECPVCQAFTLGSLAQLIADDVRTGVAKVQYRSLQTATQLSSTFRRQQAAALAAGRQNHLWDYVELFYREQGAEGSNYVTRAYLAGLATQIPGLNMRRWRTAASAPALGRQVSADESSATAAGLNSTPTLVIVGAHGTRALVGDVRVAAVEQAIQSVR